MIEEYNSYLRVKLFVFEERRRERLEGIRVREKDIE